MIEWIVDGYNETKNVVREKLFQMSESDLYDLSYVGLYTMLLNAIDEKHDICFCKEDITDAWLGSYQGDMFIIYEVQNTAYACHMAYGSCSVCDSFLRAMDSEDASKRADDLMTLLLHMVQHTKILVRHL